MAEIELYRGVPATPARADLPSHADLLARVAELERVVATLASLSRERRDENRQGAERPDPVALTAALHPGGMRSARAYKRRSTRSGTLPLRVVLFDPSSTR